MKILIVDTYYQGFLNSFWKVNNDLKNKNYEQILNKLLSSGFGTSDFYSYNLKQIGHKTVDLVLNDDILQRKWALENNLDVDKANFFSKLQNLPLIHKFIGRPNWVQKIALAQIKKERPDVVYMQDLSILNPDTLKKVKKQCKLLVGQIACPLPAADCLKQFDLIITSFPHYVKKFEKMGIKSEYLPLAFEPRVLKRVISKNKKYNVSFVGGISLSHIKGLKTLNYIADRIRLDVWGYGKKILSKGSNLYKYHHGEAWAFDMYKLLSESKITINRHIDVAEGYANNMRLFEATGMGAMLITDKKKNLSKLFNVGKEIIEYDNNSDLLDKINYYLKHDKERVTIAEAGQKRTLNDYTYKRSMINLVKIIKKYMI